jgi:hypothetical protein
LEWRWRIPRKNDDKGWRQLNEKISSDAKRWWPRRVRIGLANVDKIDKQIAATSRQKASAAKEKKLKKLRGERKRMVHDFL